MQYLRIQRIASILLPLLFLTGSLFAPAVSASNSAAYQTNATTEVNRTIAEISRAERSGDMNLLYDLMLPEARMEIARTAFNNWWSENRPAAPADVLKLVSTDFQSMTYDLTGTDYDDVATVVYTYHDESGNEIERTVALANVGGMWRWMPDITQEDIPYVQSFAGFTVNFSSNYSTETYQELDTYWAQIFSDWGMEYRSPVDMIGVRTANTPTGCGEIESPDEVFAQYCTADETIYFNPEMRDLVIQHWSQSTWDMVIAHEWGHHVQNISGMYVSKSPELFGGHYSIEHELMADCLSATFMQDATVRGVFEISDMDDVQDMIVNLGGDTPEVTWDDITAHGTSDQRLESFGTGFDDGLRGCNFGPR